MKQNIYVLLKQKWSVDTSWTDVTGNLWALKGLRGLTRLASQANNVRSVSRWSVQGFPYFTCVLVLILTVLQHLYSNRQGRATGAHRRVSHHEECVGSMWEKFFDVVLGGVVVHRKLVLHVIWACKGWKCYTCTFVFFGGNVEMYLLAHGDTPAARWQCTE